MRGKLTASLLQGALFDKPLQVFRLEPAGLDGGIALDPFARLLERIDLEDAAAPAGQR